MSKFTVYMRQYLDVAVHVEADDVDDALDVAYDEMSPDICAQCSGWGQEWSRDVGEAEAYQVVDGGGETVWEEKTPDGAR